jgi:hypothetical protein
MWLKLRILFLWFMILPVFVYGQGGTWGIAELSWKLRSNGAFSPERAPYNSKLRLAGNLSALFEELRII